MKVADGFEPGAVIGPLIDMKAVEKVEAHIGDALKKGAKIVIGGEGSALGGGLFEPTPLPPGATHQLFTRGEALRAVGPPSHLKNRGAASRRAGDHQVCPPALVY